MNETFQLAGGGDYQMQAQHYVPSCPDPVRCEECQSAEEGHREYLEVMKDKPFNEKIEFSITQASALYGALNFGITALLIGAVFHTYIIKFFQNKLPKIKIEK
jgi:hypothetical protein